MIQNYYIIKYQKILTCRMMIFGILFITMRNIGYITIGWNPNPTNRNKEWLDLIRMQMLTKMDHFQKM